LHFISKKAERGDYINIIFLDIDGVLNSMAYFELSKRGNKQTVYNEISDFHLQMLAKIYHTCNAKIVLSSTWREMDNESDISVYPMYQYLIESLAKYNMKIFSKTPVLGMNRPLEIITWLNNQVDKENIRFVSLDDDFSKEDYKRYGIDSCLIQTRFFCYDKSEGGLQQRHVDMAIKKLRDVYRAYCYRKTTL
jgi:hypothetical protein